MPLVDSRVEMAVPASTEDFVKALQAGAAAYLCCESGEEPVEGVQELGIWSFRYWSLEVPIEFVLLSFLGHRSWSNQSGSAGVIRKLL